MCTVIDVAAGRTTPWLLRSEAVSSGGRGGRIVNIRLDAEPRFVKLAGPRQEDTPVAFDVDTDG